MLIKYFTLLGPINLLKNSVGCEASEGIIIVCEICVSKRLNKY